MKIFTYNGLYRGQVITKEVCAKNAKEASEKLQLNIYTVRKYCWSAKTENTFEGVIAYFDSGHAFVNRADLIRVKMPFNELKKIIDKIKDIEYKEFKKRLLI
jgi:hypothetical protein